MTKISLSDGAGFVEFMEVFGSDLTVVNAARVSFANESKELTERDKKLIVYLAKHGHISPFFHPQIRLRLKMPIFVAREWFRHTVGFARNEVSRRYVDFEPELFAAAEWRERDTNKKQGSKADAVECNDEIAQLVGDWNKGAIDLYNTLLEKRWHLNWLAPFFRRICTRSLLKLRHCRHMLVYVIFVWIHKPRRRFVSMRLLFLNFWRSSFLFHGRLSRRRRTVKPLLFTRRISTNH